MSDELERAPAISPGALAEEPMRMPSGTMVSGRYRIARVLGEGGMGVVYAAEHVLMRKEVAVKVLHPQMCSVPEVVARFEREAIAAAHIDHPNVAGATDFGRLPDGACYLVLELLRGRSLRDEVDRGPIPLRRALEILRGIASGVSAAHAKGIVHRDLKPENVMLIERDGSIDFVKVLDFGIAKVDSTVAAAPQAGASAILTSLGSVFGTPEYMSPEQAVGDVVDARADLYALGVVFLEMLTGKCPFEGNPAVILRERILAAGPPDLSGVSDPGARALIERLLVRELDARMQAADELVAAVDALLDGSGSTPAPEGPHGIQEPPAETGPQGSIAEIGLVTPGPVAAEPPAAPVRTRSRALFLVPSAVVMGLGISAAAYALVSTLAHSKVEVRATEGAPVGSMAPPSEAASAPSEPDPVGPPEETREPKAATSEAAPTVPAAAARAAPPPRAKPSPKRRAVPSKKVGPGGPRTPPSR